MKNTLRELAKLEKYFKSSNKNTEKLLKITKRAASFKTHPLEAAVALNLLPSSILEALREVEKESQEAKQEEQEAENSQQNLIDLLLKTLQEEYGATNQESSAEEFEVD